MEINSFNILFIDDVSFYKSLIQSHLDFMKVDYALNYAANADQGVEQLMKASSEKKSFNLIICDLNMPLKSGLDFIREIKILENFKTIPFILITAESEKTVLLDALQEGADSFLLKPWSVDDFMKAIDSAFKKKGYKYSP